MHEKKIVNLDDSANTVSITIGGKAFEISRITLRARSMYGEYLIFCGEYLQTISRIQNDVEGADAEKAEALSKEMTDKITSFAIGKAKHITEILTVILEKNNYQFEQAWWEENTDYQGMEAFIVQAMKKDEDGKRTDPKKETES